jgi:hypothetical protein
MRTLLIVGAAVVLMLILVMALLCRAKRIDEHYPESLGSADLREREARASGRGCVVKRVYAGSDLLRAQRPIAEVNKRFAAILKAPELDDLKKIQIDHLYLAPSDYDGLTSRGQ